jgi:FixJ family two-component response regulator
VAIKAKQCIVAVVDDDPRIRESVRDLLVSAGFGSQAVQLRQRDTQGRKRTLEPGASALLYKPIRR